MSKKPTNIRKYRKPININIGMLIFSAIFVYVIICIYIYFNTNHIVRYEVKEGSLAINNIYHGVIVRDEKVVNTGSAGYINYFTYDGERVAVGDLVYTIDETGRLNEYLTAGDFESSSLSDKELRDFRSDISNYMHSFDETEFKNTYDFKHNLQNTVLKLANINMINSIVEMNSDSNNVISYCRAPLTGIVTYWTDGYENLTADTVSATVFDDENYEKKQILGGTLLSNGDTAYKAVLSEEWDVVISIDRERGEMLEKEGYVKVRFLKNQYESWGQTKLLFNADGNTYLKLSFNTSMISFITDRFLDVELILHEETGLKIPVSSIVEKEFYLIPKEYIIEDSETNSTNVLRQCYLEDGTISTQLTSVEVYSYDEEADECYLDAGSLNAGDVLYKTDGQAQYTVSKRATLIGVYNINKGYADFKEIKILYQNDEYAIVKGNTKYGLNVYDYIVLSADSVKDDQFIKEQIK